MTPAMNFNLNLRRRGLGDTVMASALVRDLCVTFPGVRLSVSGREPEVVFAHDSRVSTEADPDATEITLDHCPTLWRAATDPTARYGLALHDDFERQTGLSLLRGPSVPSLVLAGSERERPRSTPYAVVCSGVKSDIPVKQWGPTNFAAVVARVRGIDWIQLGDVMPGRVANFQSAVPGAENRLGRTGVREFFRWIAHAEVVMCHLSLPALLAAAFDVPCVVVAGGRETPSLFADSGMTLFHSVGRLSCCADRGCLAAAALPDKRPEEFPRGWLCTDPVVPVDGVPVGRCMTLIDPAEVAGAVESLLASKITSPRLSQCIEGVSTSQRRALPVVADRRPDGST